MLSHGQTVHFRPHSVIHNQKAEHQSIPKIRLKVNFRHPMKRQIFGDTSGKDPNLHLALCPICTSEEALDDTQWDKDVHLCGLRQNVQSIWKSQKAPPHSQWGETAHMCTMRQIIQSSWRVVETPFDP